jgi:hypothetical protein
MQANMMKAAPAGRVQAGRRVRRRSLVAAAARAHMHTSHLLRALSGKGSSTRPPRRALGCRCIGGPAAAADGSRPRRRAKHRLGWRDGMHLRASSLS